MKTRKTMWELLMAYHKKCGGYSTVVILSELLWNNAYITMAVETSSGTECSRVRVPRTMHTYRLKSAHGDYRMVKATTKMWELKRHCTTIGRLTANPLSVYAHLYLINRNGGASHETV